MRAPAPGDDRAPPEAAGSPGSPAGHPAPIRIRPARAADLPRILDVELACFSSPWSPSSFRSLLDRDRVLFVVAEEVGGGTDAGGPADASRAPTRVLGHGVLWWVAREGELANLAVAPEARRRGVASRLLEHLLEGAARAGVRVVFLEVRASNEEAMALYRKRGFRQVGLRRQYYREPVEDAGIFRLEI